MSRKLTQRLLIFKVILYESRYAQSDEFFICEAKRMYMLYAKFVMSRHRAIVRPNFKKNASIKI